ncbi:MAG: crotonase/enoyl-CoA hydratase family protein [Caulobacterales bacterium]
MAERVKVTMDRGVAEVRLNRPDKMNALDGGMFEALIEAGERLKRDANLRAVVISGAGRAFCAGLDVHTLEMLTPSDRASHSPFASATEQRPYGIANRVQYAVWVWHELPVPVIAAVHGAAMGSGLELALGADIRIVTADTRMAMVEVDWGMVPDMCGVHLMRALARDDAVRELMFTSRVFTGEQAVAMGLASRLAEDPRQEALKLAHEIAGKSPDAVRAVKRLLNFARDRHADEVLVRETEEQLAVFGRANQVEAFQAHTTGREPRFADLSQ